MDRYLVLNGPNLNLLGIRDPSVYGSTTLEGLEDLCRAWGAELGVEIQASQSNHEGDLIDDLHAARHARDGVIFNPGAFSHTSYALHDAIEAIGVSTVEVHISNIEEREEWRRRSVVRPACVATVYGRGIDGYRWGMRHLFHRREWPASTESYGPGPDHILDIRRPGGPAPVVVLVHGGFWRHMWTRDLMDGVAIDLARRGFITANVEYRRVGPTSDGGWPESTDDVVAAIEHAASLTATRPVVVVGHSAGGHLALTAATRTDIDCLPVSLAGILDLPEAIAARTGDGAVEALLRGHEPGEASPSRLLTSGEVFVFHGTADDRVPVSQSRRYTEANPDARLTELGGVGHFEFLERSDPAWMTVAETLEKRLL